MDDKRFQIIAKRISLVPWPDSVLHFSLDLPEEEKLCENTIALIKRVNEAGTWDNEMPNFEPIDEIKYDKN
jgi:hypothetical protein